MAAAGEQERVRFAAPIMCASGVVGDVVSDQFRNWPSSSRLSLVEILSVPVGVSRQKLTVSELVGMKVGVRWAENVKGDRAGLPAEKWNDGVAPAPMEKFNAGTYSAADPAPAARSRLARAQLLVVQSSR